MGLAQVHREESYVRHHPNLSQLVADFTKDFTLSLTHTHMWYRTPNLAVGQLKKGLQ